MKSSTERIIPALCILMTTYSAYDNFLIKYVDLTTRQTQAYIMNLNHLKEMTIGQLLNQFTEYRIATERLERELSEYDDVFTVLVEEGSFGERREESLFHLAVYLKESGGGNLECEFFLDSNFFPLDIREQIQGHLSRSLEILAYDQDMRVKQVDIIGEDKRLIVEHFNKTKFDWGDIINSSYSILFEKQASVMPDEIALQYGTVTMSYSALKYQANQIAWVLIDVGVKKGDNIAVVMDRGIELIVTIVALWKIGAVYIPLDKQYPENRMRMILDDCDPKMIITETIGNLPDAYMERHLTVGDLFQKKDQYANDNIPIVASTNDLSYIIYTSGTTGKAKGVMIEHLGMTNHLLSKIADFQLTEKSVVAQTASHCFDISIWQMFSPLLTGGRVIIYSHKTVTNIGLFLKKIIEDRITVLEIVPSYLSVMLDWIRRRNIRMLGHDLTFLLVTGEILPGKSAQQWIELFPDIRIVNAYGPTEASDDITHCFITPYHSTRVPVGKPIHNMEIFIVNHFGLCPIGVKGEIWVRGLGVGRGYLNDSQKTETVFVSVDLLQDGKLSRYYRTGDIGCWNSDGEILYFGRNDDQVKYKGYRIETTEIDIVMMECSSVKESITLLQMGENQEKELVTFIRPENEEIDIASVKSEVMDKLPYYMIPSHIEIVTEYPLTDNGKVDKKKLVYSYRGGIFNG